MINYITDNPDLLVALIGSTIIATIISSVFSFIQGHDKNRLEYIVEERTKWRGKLREIAAEIYGCEGNIGKYLIELKTRINAFGIYENNPRMDSHIWKNIADLEKLNPDAFYLEDMEKHHFNFVLYCNPNHYPQ